MSSILVVLLVGCAASDSVPLEPVRQTLLGVEVRLEVPHGHRQVVLPDRFVTRGDLPGGPLELHVIRHGRSLGDLTAAVGRAREAFRTDTFTRDSVGPTDAWLSHTSESRGSAGVHRFVNAAGVVLECLAMRESGGGVSELIEVGERICGSLEVQAGRGTPSTVLSAGAEPTPVPELVEPTGPQRVRIVIRSGPQLDAEVRVDLTVVSSAWGGTGRLRTVTVDVVDVVEAGTSDPLGDLHSPQAVAGVQGIAYRMWLSSEGQLLGLEAEGEGKAQRLATQLFDVLAMVVPTRPRVMVGEGAEWTVVEPTDALMAGPRGAPVTTRYRVTAPRDGAMQVQRVPDLSAAPGGQRVELQGLYGTDVLPSTATGSNESTVSLPDGGALPVRTHWTWTLDPPPPG